MDPALGTTPWIIRPVLTQPRTFPVSVRPANPRPWGFMAPDSIVIDAVRPSSSGPWLRLAPKFIIGKAFMPSCRWPKHIAPPALINFAIRPVRGARPTDRWHKSLVDDDAMVNLIDLKKRALALGSIESPAGNGEKPQSSRPSPTPRNTGRALTAMASVMRPCPGIFSGMILSWFNVKLSLL